MKRIESFITIFLFFSLFGCSGNFLESKIKDINTGTYHLYGTKIEKRLCYVGSTCEHGEVLSADTIETEFDIGIEYLPGRTDSLSFRDLEHAGTAKIKGSKLTFDHNEWGHVYTGTGFLGGGEIVLKTEYRYRSRAIEYHLQGEKTDDEVLR